MQLDIAIFSRTGDYRQDFYTVSAIFFPLNVLFFNGQFSFGRSKSPIESGVIRNQRRILSGMAFSPKLPNFVFIFFQKIASIQRRHGAMERLGENAIRRRILR